MADFKLPNSSKVYLINPKTGEKIDLGSQTIVGVPKDDKPFKKVELKNASVKLTFASMSKRDFENLKRLLFPSPLQRLVSRISRWFSSN